jgi:hypothetical protein
LIMAPNPSSRFSPLRVLRVNKILSAAADTIVVFFTRRARRSEEREGRIRAAFMLPIFAVTLIAAGLPRADDAAIRAAIRAIYAPYNAPEVETSSMDRRVFSVRTQALINRWQNRRPTDEVTPMSESDWFCQCQDWDSKGFRVTAITLHALAKGKVRAKVSYDLGWDEARTLTFVMLGERGQWKVDDLLYEDEYGSLTKQLAKEIALTPGTK